MKNRRWCQDHTQTPKAKEQGVRSDVALALIGFGILIIVYGFIVIDMLS